MRCAHARKRSHLDVVIERTLLVTPLADAQCVLINGGGPHDDRDAQVAVPRIDDVLLRAGSG
jgi:hypothetical protein